MWGVSFPAGARVQCVWRVFACVWHLRISMACIQGGGGGGMTCFFFAEVGDGSDRYVWYVSVHIRGMGREILICIITIIIKKNENNQKKK
jgi:hypothetical protein